MTKLNYCITFLDSIGVNVTYLWVPSHNGIQGNEIADDLVKNATRRNCDPEISTVNLDLSLSEIKSIIKRHGLKIWQQQYISNSTGAFYKKCFPSIYNRNIFNCSQIHRLQTGHCRLNSHMQRIGLHDTGLCSNCNVPEDVVHYHFVCSKYNHQRSILIKELKKLNVKFTLQILFDPKATLSLSTFLKTSGEVI